MKNLIIVLLAAVGLAGCIAVPYHAGPGTGYYYGPPAPPANVYFRYDHHNRYQHRRW